VVCALEAAPYVGRQLATLESLDRPDLSSEARKEALASEDYGTALARAIRIFPLDSFTWSSLATHYESRINQPLDIYDYSGRIEAAFQQAMKLNPYRDVNRQGDALDVMKEGVQTNPNQLILRLLLIRELERLGDYPLATYHVKQALLTIAPEETELYLRLAELYEIQGQYTDAKLYYLYARQAVPETPQTTVRLNRLKERLGM
jgi:tetratricopeptide (TPR) repeat protein